MSAAEAFVSLADHLRPHQPTVETDVPAAVEHPACACAERTDAETREAIRAARLFRARLADAFDALLESLARDCAAAVLARELQLAPADVAAIARTLLAERGHDAVRLRVAPGDAAPGLGVSVTVDPALLPGDVVLECAAGAVDARLGVRLADVLEAVLE